MDIYQQPNPCNLGKETIFAIGELVAENLAYTAGSSLDSIITNLGGSISYHNLMELDQLGTGSIKVEDKGDFKIFLATHTSEVRDRFTICHELGHYYLHYLYQNRHGVVVQKLEAARYGSTLAEYEANWFAAAFLMPTSLFKKSFADLKGDLTFLASKFGVSYQAAEVRAKALELI